MKNLLESQKSDAAARANKIEKRQEKMDEQLQALIVDLEAVQENLLEGESEQQNLLMALQRVVEANISEQQPYKGEISDKMQKQFEILTKTLKENPENLQRQLTGFSAEMLTPGREEQ